MSEGRILILLGPPGSGKGTQASRLSRESGLPHVSTGELFREHLGRGTELGRQARQYMESGRLVPDDLVTGMLFERVAQADCVAGFVLDGFPRTLPQAEALERGLGGRWSLLAVLLEVSDDTLIARAAGRLTCGTCGAVFHAEFSPPAVGERCDRCQGKLHRRDDDEPAVVRERLRIYQEQTAPLVSYYRGLGILEVIDGERAPDLVYAALERMLSRAAR